MNICRICFPVREVSILASEVEKWWQAVLIEGEWKSSFCHREKEHATTENRISAVQSCISHGDAIIVEMW